MALLEVNSLTAFYGDFQALYGVSMSVDAGQAVAVIGANGAGKSTLLKSIVGMIRAAPEMIRFDGEPIGGILVGLVRCLRSTNWSQQVRCGAL